MAKRYVEGWLDVSGPDIGGGRPDNELPGGGHVDNELPGGGAHPWWISRLVKWLLGPHVGGGPIGKPPGIPILPPDPEWDIPVDPPHPWLPGCIVIVDPGFGKPPALGWKPVDPGYGVGGGGGGTLPIWPGHWVPGDPDYDKPLHERRCGGGEHVWGKPQPLWIWIIEVGPDYGKPQPKSTAAAKK